jgi:putative transposase
MLLRFAYLAFCAILRLGLCRSDGARREAELIVLRHELAVLRRTAGRPRLDWADRALFAALIGALRPDRRAGRIVAPATLVRWHATLPGVAGTTRTADQAAHQFRRRRAG